MSLSCILRGVSKKLTGGPLKCSAAILSNSGPHYNLSQLGHHTTQWLEQNQRQCPSVSLKHVKNFSLSPNRLSASHDHGKLWGVERLVSASLLGTVPLALLFPSQAMDSILALSMVMHSHWGIEACVVDYVRPIIFGPVIPKVAVGLLYLLSIGSLAGLFYLIFNDMGLANAILKFWKL